MAIPKRKSLAGTCGIPKEQDRIYVKTFAWEIQASSSRREFGREIFGNLCVHIRVTVKGRQRDLWWEHGDWFVLRDE